MNRRQKSPVADAILNAQEMKEVERAAFADGIDAESLMDRAGEGIANAILEQEPHPGICVAYLGKGNNAGDAIVAGSLLAKAGWEIWFRPLVPESDLQGASQEEMAETAMPTGFRARSPICPRTDPE